MIPNKWPWSWAEEAKWQEELHRDEFGWMEDLLDHMIHDRMASPSFNPLQPDEETDKETAMR